MPLFARTEPELRSLIAYMVARSADQGISVHRTKLVKLLYLIDVERVRGGRGPLTGLEWTFSHHGPHDDAVAALLAEMLDRDLTMPTWKEARVRRGAPEAPHGEDWPASTKGLVDRVLDRFAPVSLDEVLDHVYFRTGPMRGARRGEALDLERAGEDAPRRVAPLAVPDRVAPARLAAWRERAQAPADAAPGAGLPAPAPPGTGLRGRLRVPEAP